MSFAGYDPRVHGKGQIQTGNVLELKIDDLLNIRWHAGMEIEGFKVKADTRDLPSMGFQIKERGGIIKPIVVSERDNKDLVVLAGNRRTGGARWLIENDPEVKDEKSALYKELTQKTPMVVFKKLTPEQERLLVNDQEGMKPYMRSEIVREVFALAKDGADFNVVASSMVEQISSALGSRKKLTEYRAIPADQHEMRKKFLVGWLKGTLGTYWMSAAKMGQPIRKATLLSEMMQDGLLNKDDEKPAFLTTKESQTRMGNLKKAKEEDDNAGAWSDLTGGPKMNALMAQYHDEDFNADGTVKEKDKAPKKGMSDNDIKKALTEGKVKAPQMRAALQAVTGDFTGDLNAVDDKLMAGHLKESTYLQYKSILNDGPVKTCLDLVFNGMDLVAFEQFLKVNCPEGAKPTPPAPVDANAQPAPK